MNPASIQFSDTLSMRPRQYDQTNVRLVLMLQEHAVSVSIQFSDTFSLRPRQNDQTHVRFILMLQEPAVCCCVA